uniref:Rhodanese domain-containing protein n=1 Tax=Syphacia muris TaxID=451379 RepID=A0A0N5ASV9_9BILA
MLLSGEYYPAITIDQAVEILIKKTGKNVILILDSRPPEEYKKGHIINANLFSPFCLSRTKYETEAMIEAKRNGTVVAVCGERYNGGDVVATLCQRGYNAALIRADYGYWKKKYPEGLLTNSDSSEQMDLAKLEIQYAENKRPKIERSNLMRGTTSSEKRTRQMPKRNASRPSRKPWK